MKQCNLCQKAPPDKKGSHIIPHFLMKRIDNIPSDKKSRDKELGFLIGEDGIDSYFGRSVLPDKLKEIYSELEGEGFEKYKPKLIVDHFFCSKCEDRFSAIESIYSKAFNSNVSSKLTSQVNGVLFWLSVIWRASIFDGLGFDLKAKEIKRARKLLDKYLHIDMDKPNFLANVDLNDFDGLSYVLIRSEGYNKSYPSTLFFHPKHRRPYSFIVDELVIFFYFKESYYKCTKQEFFGFDEFLYEALLKSYSDGEERIIKVSNNDFKKCIDKLKSFFITKQVDYFNYICDGVHQGLGGKGNKMPQFLKDKIFREYTSEEKKIGEKYTFDNLVYSINKVLNETKV